VVNQLREVVDEVVSAGKDFNYGLEAGSKPELMIALAMHDGGQRLIICNGYKDKDYMRLAMLGRKLGKKIIIVIEQLSEVDNIVEIAKETGVKPMIGFRVKLQTRGEGKWAMSTGDNAKFGLNTAEILFAVEKLRAATMQSSLRLVHFHIGSQVPNIITIKAAVTEGVQARDAQQVADKLKASLTTDTVPLQIPMVGASLPMVGDWFNSINPGIAGLILIFRSLFQGVRMTVFMLPAAAAMIAAPALDLYDLQLLPHTHLLGLAVGVGIAVVGFFFGRTYD